MRLSNDNEKFDTCLTASDWRYSAAIVGLCKYFKYYKHELEYELSDDYLKFNAADITEDRYLKLAESYFEDQFQHRELEKYMNLEKLVGRSDEADQRTSARQFRYEKGISER